MTGIRLPIFFSLSLFTTAALFWFLGMLVSGGPAGEPIPIIPDIEFTMLIPDDEPVRKPRVKPPIEKPAPRRNLPTIPLDESINPIRDIHPSEVVPLGVGEGVEGIPIEGDPDIALRSGTDRGALPQMRIEPDYPAQAKARGIEGWITFRFTVAKDGSVKDIEIVDAEPPRIWDRSTIRAVSNWKYQPRIQDGKPVEQVGLIATYRFELDRR